MENRTLGTFTLRVILGLIFLMQGWGKIFKYGMDGLYKNVFQSYEELLPSLFLWLTAYYTSFIELIAGFLLVIGLFRKWALLALASVLIIVTFGHGIASPIWDLSHVFPRTVMLVALLFLPKEWDKWHLDSFMSKK